MEQLINLNEHPISAVLDDLLMDKTTKKNIVFATSIYGTNETDFITKDFLKSDEVSIQPRVFKSRKDKGKRTRYNGEVFTPSWICNKMNNDCDEVWFERKNVFNVEGENSWETNKEKISFDDNKTWKDYVLTKKLEITCGEAPYIVSRYDSSTGSKIDIDNRIGFLDRKIRVINENVSDEKEWFEWVYRAYQSVYGYEFQGDNLLIARSNLVLSFDEYVQNRWNRKSTKEELKRIADIVTWNVWQMDGLAMTVPYSAKTDDFEQINLFEEPDSKENKNCKIYDWDENKEMYFFELKNN